MLGLAVAGSLPATIEAGLLVAFPPQPQRQGGPARMSANAARFNAVAALLADDLRTEAQAFENTLQGYSWSREYDGGIGAIDNGRFFEEQLARFLNGARRFIEEDFPKLASIASQQCDLTIAVESATAVVTSAVREHCNPESMLRRAFPALSDEPFDLPPGLTPPQVSDPGEAICSRIKTSLDNSVVRIARQTLRDGLSNAGVRTNAEPADTKPRAEAEPTGGNPADVDAKLDSAFVESIGAPERPINAALDVPEEKRPSRSGSGDRNRTTEYDYASAERKLGDPSKYPSMTAREVAAGLGISIKKVYELHELEPFNSGTQKRLWTTASVLAVRNSYPKK